ncbi:MAG: hypothetical protein ABIA04_14495 [Pseudomonadota bacterium]
MSTYVVNQCLICAWRDSCNKKYIYSGSNDRHCPEFTKDVRLDKKHKDESIRKNED